MEAVCRVIDSQPLTPTTHVIRTEKPPGFAFQPGQHVSLELETKSGPDDRFLSIASAPHENHLEFAVRLSDSEFKQAFQQLRTGDAVTIMGPSGRFKRDPERPAILVSGGIGITPLRSMLLDAKEKGLPTTRLVYGNRTPSDIPYRIQLDAVADVLHTVDEPGKGWSGAVGHIGPELIDLARTGLDAPVYYLCGPPGMVLAITRTLSGMGIKDLRVENFNGY